MFLQVVDCVKSLDLPPPINVEGFGVAGTDSVSLVTDANLDHLFPPSRSVETGVVSWSPPTPNWNPWSGCNIDQGPLASASMDDISQVKVASHSEAKMPLEPVQKFVKKASKFHKFLFQNFEKSICL